MDPTTELVLRILGLMIALSGLAVVFTAARIVDRKHLDEKKEIPPEMQETMTPEEKKIYRRDMAILDVKLKGLLIAVPGFVLILIAFR